ncbi:hypothetical protein C9J12_14175 [Photobacterium frigidiphilum]|uniref:Uncharacterized protein n=1 Tax=Photobacterium frigidiphilum TaxID=264736 RepID=A0A2T3JFJ6_9GAMM|nr:hypothetical protein [Photobacterium frigidiphilum]PSU47691.1 hypothetical protein C9J12_14175 [Photobacterium frigidiphilum]
MSNVIYLLLILVASYFVMPVVYAQSLSIELQQRLFTHNNTQVSQHNAYTTALIKGEIGYEWENVSLGFEPLVSISNDDALQYADIQQLLLTHYFDTAQIFYGIDTVFWGVTESYHLVDIINQVNIVADPKREAKLGQPMIGASWFIDNHTVDLYYLPYFREQYTPESNSRPWRGLPINDKAMYESSREQKHVDWAVRLSGFIDDIDYGFGYFRGTQRNPIYELHHNSSQLALTPFYYQTQQWSIDLQYTYESWLFKGEIVYESPNSLSSQYAWVGGFEYGIYNIVDSSQDISLLLEGLYSNNKDSNLLPFTQHIMSGLRWDANNDSSTNALLTLIHGIEGNDSTIYINAQHRINESISLSLDGWLFYKVENQPQLAAYQNEDYFQFNLTYHL